MDCLRTVNLSKHFIVILVDLCLLVVADELLLFFDSFRLRFEPICYYIVLARSYPIIKMQDFVVLTLHKLVFLKYLDIITE